MASHAYKVYSEMLTRRMQSAPFFMNEGHIQGGRVTRNGSGTQYAFTDGSRLTVSRRTTDGSALNGTNTIKCFSADKMCVAVMAMRVAIEPK